MLPNWGFVEENRRHCLLRDEKANYLLKWPKRLELVRDWGFRCRQGDSWLGRSGGRKRPKPSFRLALVSGQFFDSVASLPCSECILRLRLRPVQGTDGTALTTAPKSKTPSYRPAFYVWTGRELNPRHMDFQSIALPTELPVRKFTNLASPTGEAKFDEFSGSRRFLSGSEFPNLLIPTFVAIQTQPIILIFLRKIKNSRPHRSCSSYSSSGFHFF
ncbi:MAG: hypothetical protein HW389_2950 [Bacteroidetes bacterium]|nr:hypothetical protein [Bacteroidota bacterium]